MSYSFTGPPTEFNGTNPITGGDSGEYIFIYVLVDLHVQSATLVLRATCLCE
jgi:hypothetical protein